MDVALTHPESGITATGGMMRQIKNLTIVIAVIFLFGVVFLNVAAPAQDAQASDPPAFYKAKCVACHGQKAEKKFDAALTEEQQIEAIMKGKKVEKPPHMPAYGEKGVTAEQAKALLDYMKQLRSTP
jgi:mono/diheme cytochrome c family protein